jgi:hypothetical protein
MENILFTYSHDSYDIHTTYSALFLDDTTGFFGKVDGRGGIGVTGDVHDFKFITWNLDAMILVYLHFGGVL